MTRIAIDPITRIEGHLRIEARVDGGVVTDAWSSSTMFRGMEIVLRDRDPRDAWLFAQRICGVCTTVHALASVRAVEDALDIEIPANAQLIRNIIAGTQWVQDHVIHFYHLHALDWVDVASALKADPRETSRLAVSLSPWPKSSADYFKSVQDRLRKLTQSGADLGLFANGYWGHPAYQLAPAVNLLAVAHYLEALEWQREVIKVQAILGAKNPHPQTYLVGGMAIPIDPTSQAAINDQRLAEQLRLIRLAKTFVEQVYIPDLLAIGSAYKDWAKHGAAAGNYLSYGDFPTAGSRDPQSFWIPRGVIAHGDLAHVLPLDEKRIGEYVARSWFTYSAGDGAAKHPFDGETNPKYTGPQPPYNFLHTDDKYSWVKAPRYDEMPMEVGPLARLLIGYASGHREIRTAVDTTLRALGLGLPALGSTLGRIVARGIETQLMVDRVLQWHADLVANVASGDLRVHNGTRWDPASWPQSAAGWGAHEGPRGSLGHWIRIKNRVIENYQCVVPTTWNASPRDAAGTRGPYETALLGTPVADPQRPLEILRTVHSFDPCMACAVHVTNAGLRVEQPQLRRDVVYVWEIPVRVTHWVNALAIFALSITGLYIAWPFLNGGGFTMRWAQAAHLMFGCIFLSSVMFRVYWSLRGNRWASYRAFFPIFTREGRQGMRHAFLYYIFARRVLPGGVGHNALAATTYTLVFTLFIVEIVTGFAMLTFNWGGGWHVALGWVFALAPPQRIHLVHYMGMWLLLGFVVHHIYSATLFDVEGREGEISSIISGYKTVRRHGGKLQ